MTNTSDTIANMATSRVGSLHRKRCFADGGEISKADQMIADINAKYGVSGNTPTPQPQATPPAPPPPQQSKPAGSLIEKAAGIFGNRQKQIDKAASYRNGGSLNDEQLAELSPTLVNRRRIARHRQKQRVEILDNIAAKGEGGKISGPGTATSDSIPATIQETGEPIKVSNKERIVSAKQEELLRRISELLGFKSLDAMLEAGTGKPVGPTIKGGRRAAADGWSLDNKPDEYSNAINAAVFNDAEKIGPSTTPSIAGQMLKPVTDLFADSAQAARTGQSYSDVKAARQAAETPQPAASGVLPVTPSYPMSRDPNAKALLGTTEAQASKPGDALMAAATQPNAKPVITADSAQAAYGGDMKRSGGVWGTFDGAGVNGILERENKARGEMIDSMIKANGGNGVAVLPDRTNEINMQMDINKLSPEERVKYQLAQQVSDNTQRGQDLAHQAEMDRNRSYQVAHGKDPLEQQLKGVKLEAAQRLSSLQGRLLDPKTPPEERAQIGQALQVMAGHLEKPANLQAIDVEEPIDPKQPLLGNRKVPYVFDPRAGQARPMLQGTQQDPMAQARAAISRGASRDAVNARLRQMGLEEIK